MTEDSANGSFETSHALLIGINEYAAGSGFNRLKAPVADVQTLGDVLGGLHGYTVRILTDGEASLQQIRTELGRLQQEVKSQDRLLIYFAGHGLIERREGERGADASIESGVSGYLIPASAVHDQLNTYLPMREVWQALSGILCRHIFLILDCCCAGAFRWATRSMRVRNPRRVPKQLFERYTRSTSWQVLASTAFDEPALDDGRWLKRLDSYDGTHSPFAHFLLAGLRGAADLNQDGLILGIDLFSYIEGQMAQFEQAQDNGLQVPGFFNLRTEDRSHYFFQTPGTRLELPSVELCSVNNPYRGLEPYDEAGRDVFFGREGCIEKLCKQVLSDQLTIVSAISGSGKSSLIRAGLIPDLRAQWWQVLLLDRPQEQPTLRLTNLLARHGIHLDDTDGKTEAPGAAPPDTALIIDQMEELCTIVTSQTERQRFTALLKRVIESRRATVVLAVRSDFEHQLSRLELAEYWTPQRRFLVPQMRDDELREVIEGPAEHHALRFESRHLIEQLILEVSHLPGALPLLSFTLSYLYDQYLLSGSTDRTLRASVYESLKGVTGSLHQRMDELLCELRTHSANEPSAPTPETLRDLMLRMVTQEGASLARRRVYLRELRFSSPLQTARTERLLDALVAKRLLIRGHETSALAPDAASPTGQKPTAGVSEADADVYVEPAHDAVVTSWHQLGTWLTELRRAEFDLNLHRRLSQAAAEWQRSAHSRRELWASSARLPAAEALLQQGLLNQEEEDFVRASVLERQRISQQRFRYALFIIAVLLTILGIITFLLISVQQSASSLRQARNSLADEVSLKNEANRQLSLSNTKLGEKNMELDKTNQALVIERDRLAKQILKTQQEEEKKNEALIQVEDKNTKLISEQRQRHDEKCLKAAQRFIAHDPTIAALFLRELLGSSPEHKKMQREIAQHPVSALVLPSPGRDLRGTFAAVVDSHSQLIAAYSGPQQSEIHAWAISHNGLLTTGPQLIERTEMLRNFELSQNGTFLAVAAHSPTVWVWRQDAGKLHRLPGLELGGKEGATAKLSRDGSLVLAASRGVARASLWSIGRSSLQRSAELPLPEQAHSVALSSSRRLLITSSRLESRLRLGTIGADGSIRVLTAVDTNAPVSQLAVSEDSLTLLAMEITGKVVVFSLGMETLERLWTSDGVLFSAYLDRTGSRLLGTETSGLVKIYSLGGQRDAPPVLLQGHRGHIEHAEFSPDTAQQYVLTLSRDNTVRIWDAQQGTPIHTLRGHWIEQAAAGASIERLRYISSAHFTPDGKSILTTGLDGTVRIWPLFKRSSQVRPEAPALAGCLSAGAREDYLGESRAEAETTAAARCELPTTYPL